MVRQRLTGIVLLTLALVAVLSTSALRHRTVAGVAVVAPPPQVGDCWTPAGRDPGIDELLGSAAVPVLTLGPCTGPRQGEVVAVENQRRYSSADSQTQCVGAAQRYLGLPDQLTEEIVAPDGTTRWASTVRPWPVLSGPTPAQLAAGQLWSACILLGSSASDPLPSSVRGSALQGGRAFERFSQCTDSSTAQTVVPCGEPHRYEVFLESFDVGPEEGASGTSCGEQVAELTGLADPTAGGRLAVRLLPYAYDPSAGTERRSVPYADALASSGRGLLCVVSPVDPEQRLTSTLYGINDRPLPLR